MMGVEMGSGNGERYTFIYSRVGYVGGSLDTVVLQFPRIRSSFERYTYRYKFVYEREKKKTRARSFYPSSLELITSSCDPLSNRLRASAGSKRCIIEETINASISSAQAIVSHDIITHARGKPEILPTENDIHIYTHSRIIIFSPTQLILSVDLNLTYFCLQFFLSRYTISYPYEE